MHELSICQALLSQVVELARAHDADGVKMIVIAVGPLSGVEPALLERAFNMARAGSCAAQADLKFEPASLSVLCTECGAQTACVPNRLLCGACGGYRTRVVSGDELQLLRVEMSHSDGRNQPSRHII